MLVLKDVIKRYGNKIVLNNINLQFSNCGLVFILGPSGSGKSTLLNLIGKLDSIDKGTISINEQDITDISNEEFYNNKVGFVFQHYNLINYLTVTDNLKLVTSGSPEKLINYLQLDKIKNQIVSTLSGGEQQRVAIARAIANDPQIILCDEPTGALDNLTGQKMIEILKSIAKEKLVIVVTHNTEIASKYGDRIIKLCDGKIVGDKIIVSPPEIPFQGKPRKRYKSCFKNLYSYIRGSLLNKRKRHILTTLAFSIGITSLLLVFGMATGLKESLSAYEESSLGDYPIYISETSADLTDEIETIFSNKQVSDSDTVYSYDISQKNIIDKELVDYLDQLDFYLKYSQHIYSYEGNYLATIPKKNKDLFFSNFNILAGNLPTTTREVLLLIDQQNHINNSILNIIGLHDSDYSFSELLGYRYSIGNSTFQIVGIIQGKKDSYFADSSYILYDEKNFANMLPIEFLLFPNDYTDKQNLKKAISEYATTEISYIDYANTITDVSKTLIDILSIVLSVFCAISLTICIIMMGILSYISVIERSKDLAILRVLGYTKRHLKGCFYLENSIILIASICVSSIFIGGLANILNQLIFDITALESVIILSFITVIKVWAFCEFLVLISTSIPLRYISRQNVVKALQYE